MFFRIHVFQGPRFLRSRFFWVQVFQSPGFQDPGFSGSRFFRVLVQGPGPGFRSTPNSRYSCLFNYFLIHYFDIINLLKSDKIHYVSIMNPTHYESISVTWAITFIRGYSETLCSSNFFTFY